MSRLRAMFLGHGLGNACICPQCVPRSIYFALTVVDLSPQFEGKPYACRVYRWRQRRQSSTAAHGYAMCTVFGIRFRRGGGFVCDLAQTRDLVNGSKLNFKIILNFHRQHVQYDSMSGAVFNEGHKRRLSPSGKILYSISGGVIIRTVFIGFFGLS